MSFFDNITYHSSAEDLRFSTVTEFRHDYEHETTHELSNTEETNNSSSENNESFAGFLMIYGLGGLLTFFAIYSLFTYYYLHVRDNWDRVRRDEEEEIERRRNLLRLGNLTPPSNTRSCPSFIFEDGRERRFFPEDLEDILIGSSHPQLSPSLEALVEPTHVDLSLGSLTPESVETESASYSDKKEDTSLPERKCRSSPSSCTITRRHLHDKEVPTQRPSSWN